MPHSDAVPPPDLPDRLVDLRLAVVIGTGIWALVLVVSLLLQAADRDAGIWPSTAAAGFGLGLLGLTIIAWQRRASRRGSRGAQRGL